MARLPSRPRHRLLLGRGLVSDDTDHAVFCAQSLMISEGDPEAFSKELKKRLRWWALSFPAGAGAATLRAAAKMWLGKKDTAIESAGNGAAMRAPILGAALCDNDALRSLMIDASSLATHKDPRALASARAVGELCARAARGAYDQTPPSPAEVESAMTAGIENPAWIEAARKTRRLLERQVDGQGALSVFKDRGGASGFCMSSAPMAIFLWARYFGDLEKAISEAISAGGDVDTVCALIGGLAGSAGGRGAIPNDWIEGVVDFPHGPKELSRLAKALCGLEKPERLGLSWWLYLRSPFFTALIIFHALRRLAPPYARAR